MTIVESSHFSCWVMVNSDGTMGMNENSSGPSRIKSNITLHSPSLIGDNGSEIVAVIQDSAMLDNAVFDEPSYFGEVLRDEGLMTLNYNIKKSEALELKDFSCPVDFAQTAMDRRYFSQSL